MTLVKETVHSRVGERLINLKDFSVTFRKLGNLQLF